jgi:hypothetical protein
METFKNKGATKIISLTALILWLVVVSAHGQEKTKLPNNSNSQQPASSEKMILKNQHNDDSPVKIHDQVIKQINPEKVNTINNKISFNSWTGWSEPIW